MAPKKEMQEDFPLKRMLPRFFGVNTGHALLASLTVQSCVAKCQTVHATCSFADLVSCSLNIAREGDMDDHLLKGNNGLRMRQVSWSAQEHTLCQFIDPRSNRVCIDHPCGITYVVPAFIGDTFTDTSTDTFSAKEKEKKSAFCFAAKPTSCITASSFTMLRSFCCTISCARLRKQVL